MPSSVRCSEGMRYSTFAASEVINRRSCSLPPVASSRSAIKQSPQQPCLRLSIMICFSASANSGASLDHISSSSVKLGLCLTMSLATLYTVEVWSSILRSKFRRVSICSWQRGTSRPNSNPTQKPKPVCLRVRTGFDILSPLNIRNGSSRSWNDLRPRWISNKRWFL